MSACFMLEPLQLDYSQKRKMSTELKPIKLNIFTVRWSSNLVKQISYKTGCPLASAVRTYQHDERIRDS